MNRQNNNTDDLMPITKGIFKQILHTLLKVFRDTLLFSAALTLTYFALLNVVDLHHLRITYPIKVLRFRLFQSSIILSVYFIKYFRTLSLNSSTDRKVLVILLFNAEPMMLANLFSSGCCQLFMTFFLNAKFCSQKPNLLVPLTTQDNMALLNKHQSHEPNPNPS